MATIINNPLFSNTLSTIAISPKSKSLSPSAKLRLAAKKKNNLAVLTKQKRSGSTNLGKLTTGTQSSVHGVIIPITPQANHKPTSYHPKNLEECFRRLCNTEDGEETVLQFYPFKVIMTYTQELEVQKIYGNDINFKEDTIRLKKGKGSALYFRFENDAILAKLAVR